jgi:SAM-dependent methyltransferase
MTDAITLDAEALALFARKGMEDGRRVPQAGEANGVKVRRVIQITRDLSIKPFTDLRILDLGCGEGVYAIEAGIKGAAVLALDARAERMAAGAACAARHGIEKVTFVQEDVRTVRRSTHGGFDVVYCLGLLYHLDTPDLFHLLENIYEMCDRLLIVDALVSLEGRDEVTYEGVIYRGEFFREHEDDDSREVRRSRLLRSIDNTWSLRLEKPSLVQALHESGFTSVFECYAPPEPLKAEDRVTLVAVKGRQEPISTYPWVNGRTEAEIAQRLQEIEGGNP